MVVQRQNRGVELLDSGRQGQRPGRARDKLEFELSQFLKDVQDRASSSSRSRSSVGEQRKRVVDQLQLLQERGSSCARSSRQGTRSPGPGPVSDVPGVAAGCPVVRGGDSGCCSRRTASRSSAPRPMRRWRSTPRIPGPPTTPGPWRSRCRPRSRRPRRPGFADGCYDLLLILSQAVPTRPRACGSSTGRSGFARSRRPRTTSAAPSASSARATSPAGTARIEKPSQLEPVTALDYFLNGRELVLRRRFADAIRPSNTAVQADPDQTSAHLLLAVCYLNMRPEAVERRPGPVSTPASGAIPTWSGLYLMRALVSGEEGNQALEQGSPGAPDERRPPSRQDAKEPIVPRRPTTARP